MPNGGNPEECQRAASFYKKIEDKLTSFAAVHEIDYIPWYHDIPMFLFTWPRYEWPDVPEITYDIQLYIEPTDLGHATVCIFADAYADAVKPDGTGIENRRTRTYFIAKQELPQNAERISEFLELAREILLRVKSVVLLDAQTQTLQEKQDTLEPLFD